MALKYCSLAAAVACAVLCSTASATAPAIDVTATYSSLTYGSPTAVYSNFETPAAFSEAPVEIHQSMAQPDRARLLAAHKPAPAQSRASGAAVLPSAVAGWRSGRVKRLAFA